MLRAHWDRPEGPCLCAKRRFPEEGKATPPQKKRNPHVLNRSSCGRCPALVHNADDKCDLKVRMCPKRFQDIIFGRHSLKRRLVKYIFQTRRCWKCRIVFGVDERFTLFRKYGWNLVAYFFYQVIEFAHPPKLQWCATFNRLFDFDLNGSTLYNLKVRVGRYYAETKQKILENIIQGCLVHADETRREHQRGEAGFVWVLTNMQEVIYVLADRPGRWSRSKATWRVSKASWSLISTPHTTPWDVHSRDASFTSCEI